MRKKLNKKDILKRRAKLKKQAWNYMSKYVRQRDNGTCISCGKKDHWKKMDAGHYVPKSAGLAAYFEIKNVHCQCTYCNRFMHGNLSRYAVALTRMYGPKIIEELEKCRTTITKYTDDDYIAITEMYKNKIVENGFDIK